MNYGDVVDGALLQFRNSGGNSGDICIIPESALYYDGPGQHLLFVFASLCEIILAQRFDRA
jgi:hypothetical protein